MLFRGKYSFLSNFYPCNVEYEGEIYKSVEHAYQAAKFNEGTIRSAIKNADTPSKAKKIAHTHANKVKKNWKLCKTSVMLDLVDQKFKNNDALKKRLININEPIIEHNTWGDTFWGICDGRGENNLGKILERVKMEIIISEKL